MRLSLSIELGLSMMLLLLLPAAGPLRCVWRLPVRWRSAQGREDLPNYVRRQPHARTVAHPLNVTRRIRPEPGNRAWLQMGHEVRVPCRQPRGFKVRLDWAGPIVFVVALFL